MIGEQQTIDTRDTRIALRATLDIMEWLLVRDKKRLGEQDVRKMLGRIDLARLMVSDEDESVADDA